MRRRTKNLLLAIVLMIIMGTISYFGYQKVYKKSNITKGALPSKVTIYERYKDEWRKHSTLKYEYQNDYPIKKELYEYDETTPKTTRYDFTIKNGKPTSQKIYDQDNNLTLTVKYKNGKVMSEKSVLDDGASTHEKLYQYANNDNYFTLVFHKNVSKDTSGNNYPTYYAEEVDTKTGKRTYTSTVMPLRGAWIEYETDGNDIFYVRVDRTRKIPVTLLLRAIGIVLSQAESSRHPQTAV